MKRQVVFSFSLLASCSGGVSVPLEIGSEDVAIIVATVDGRLFLSRHGFSGEEIEVESDSDEPIYTWVLKASQFAHPNGDEFVAGDFSSLVARITKQQREPDPNGRSGACNRCLIPTDIPPQIVNLGDSCNLPPFNRGAVWMPDGGDYVCHAATGGTLCAEGSASDNDLIEQVRHMIRLDWSGNCACESRRDSPNHHLKGLRLRAIAPEENPWPLNHFVQRADGLIAGFSRSAAVALNPSTRQAHLTVLSDFPARVDAAAAMRSGDFLLASREFNTGSIETFRFDRFSVENGVLQGPSRIDSNTAARPAKMKYLGDHQDKPFYLIGTVIGSVGKREPAMAACTEDTLTCQQVSVSNCPDQSDIGDITDAVVLDDGAGFAMAKTALFLKKPNPPPMVNPHPDDVWSCWQKEDAYEWSAPSTNDPVIVRQFNALGQVGNRLFICGTSETPRCEDDYAVVLTASVATMPGETPRPNWRVIHRGGDRSRCRRFLEVPGEDRQVRLLLSSSRIVDFDEAGAIVQETSVSSTFGSFPGFEHLYPLQPGWTAGISREYSVYAKQENDPIIHLYGADSVEDSTYLTIVAASDSDFIAAGYPTRLTQVHVAQERDASNFPITTRRELSDPSEALEAGDQIYQAVIDHQTSKDSSAVVLMAAGFRNGAEGREPLLIRLWIDLEAGSILQGARLSVPEDLNGLILIGVTEVGEGAFVVISQGTRILRLVGNEVTELDINFDDPTTEEPEERPATSPPSCGGDAPRLDAWRVVGGGHGAAWVVGKNSLVLRVVGDRVERFALGTTTDLSAINAACPDQVVISGFGDTVDPFSGLTSRTVQIWDVSSIHPDEIERAEEPETFDPRGIAVTQVGQEEIELLNISMVSNGIPRAVLLDAADRLKYPPYGVVMTNGHLHRFFSPDAIEHIRVPFSVETVAQTMSGYILFGANRSRLALGVPAVQ